MLVNTCVEFHSFECWLSVMAQRAHTSSRVFALPSWEHLVFIHVQNMWGCKQKAKLHIPVVPWLLFNDVNVDTMWDLNTNFATSIWINCSNHCFWSPHCVCWTCCCTVVLISSSTLTQLCYTQPWVPTETCCGIWPETDHRHECQGGSLMEPLVCCGELSADVEPSFKKVEANCLIRAAVSATATLEIRLHSWLAACWGSWSSLPSVPM